MDNRIEIGSREQLVDLLCEAAELEHNLCCSYLFAGFSLKSNGDELTGPQQATVRGWRNTLREIATQEMLHLALTSNLLTAIGAAPHFARPNFPQLTKHYPPEIRLALTPFDASTLDHFIFLERPEGADEEEGDDFAAEEMEEGEAIPTDLVPEPQSYATVSELYRGIADGFRELERTLGASQLFIGPPGAQATPGQINVPGLIPVTELDSALHAVDLIIEQGEGAPRNGEISHYARFLQIRQEYHALRGESPEFEPARPVLENPFTRLPRDVEGAQVMTDPLTVEVGDLFNGAYAAMLELLLRFFAHGEETDEELSTLIGAAIGIMAGVLTPLGDTLTKLPAGEDYPGRTAGPSFQVYRASTHMLPHKRAAWFLLQERLTELARVAAELAARRGTPEPLEGVHRTLATLATELVPATPRIPG